MGLLDHLVGEDEDGLGEREAEGLERLEDDQLWDVPAGSVRPAPKQGTASNGSVPALITSHCTPTRTLSAATA